MKIVKVFSYIIYNYIENHYLKIYDGGSDKDSLLNAFTGNALPPSTTFSTRNYDSWMNNINFHLFSPSLKVPPWGSMMVAVIRIAGTSTVTLIIVLYVLVTIS